MVDIIKNGCRLIRVLIVFVLTSLSVACSVPEYIAAANKNSECVVLLHGLARSARSMQLLQEALSDKEYSVLNLDYPSTEFTVDILTEQYLRPALQQENLSSCRKLHFVTHSMGGILLRDYLNRYELSNLGRVVMLSPPNQGSELVDKLGDIFLFRWINGPAGNQLSTAKDSLPNRLGSVDFDLAVITGNRSFNPLYSWLIPGDDDGKVAVDRARIEGMREFKVVPSTHTFIMRDETVIHYVLEYLANGHWGTNSS